MVSMLAVLSSTLLAGPGPGPGAQAFGLAASARSAGDAGLVTDAPTMVDTWGISGPDFLWVYGLALLVTTVVAVAVRARVDSRRDDGVRSVRHLSIPELAFLSGGPGLTTSVSMWTLVRGGVIVVENRLVEAARARWPLDLDDVGDAVGATELSVHRVPEDLDEVDAALVELVVGSRPARPEAIRIEHERSGAVVRLGTELVARGLMRSPAVVRRMHVAVVATFVPLLLLGMARVASGVAAAKPVDNLLVLLLAGLAAFAIVYHVPTLPWHTSRLLDSWRGHAEQQLRLVIESMRAPAPTTDESRALALLGTGVLTLGEIALGPLLAMPPSDSVIGRAAAAGGGCSSGCGSGGGGGGGSGGGGGCGG